MRTFVCRVFVLYLGFAGTAVAAGGGGTGAGLSRSALMTFRPQYRHHLHHYAQHLERKIITRSVAKAGHHHLRPSGYAEDLMLRHNVSSEISTTQTLINNTNTLSLGTPLLGLDPRSPSTWALYSEMLPFIFSEAPAQTSDRAGAPRRREEDAGM
jgi:hypothetical protein